MRRPILLEYWELKWRWFLPLGFILAIFSVSLLADSSDVSVALDAAFDHLEKADGYKAEELDVVIGKYITKTPTEFLRVLKKRRPKVTRLDALVGNLGPEFVDDSKKQAKELKDRIAALEGVQDKSLRHIREECLEALRAQLKIIKAP